ncbi:MAG: hypothetical protein K6C95_08690 [Lachnospiraceae bacterium]|nr:hypothetical protein [Lachnospiraceae bacterium]
MIRYAKRGIAAVMTAAMLFSNYSVPLSAYDAAVDTSVFEAAEQVEAPVFNEGEEGGEQPTQNTTQSEINIEINQGFSLHVKKDQLTSEQPTYMSNFVAGKNTAVMFSVDAADEAKAKEVTANWELYYKDSEGNEKLRWKGDEFAFQKYYDEDSNEYTGKMMAYVSMNPGPAKGKYNFYLSEGDKELAKYENVDFYETKPLNILAVPVNSYYSVSANVQPAGGGGCPSDKINQAVPCDDSLWNGIDNKIKTYLLDVYPVAEVNVDIGQPMEAGTAEYDMCTDDGQRKLWEEACKLQSKDKEGKDKYDIILAFVMYRQDANGCGQGYTFGKPVNIITLTDIDMLPTVAHEIAHCYGVGDEYSGGSYNYRVNNTPMGYTDKGRDKVTGEDVTDTTEWTIKNVEAYTEANKDSYYWLSGGQYQSKLGTKTAYGKAADSVNQNGSGSVISPSLHPFRLSDKTFVHYAEKDGTVYPTISYMGSGYSGSDDYYFTTSVIWDHLFNEFMVKERQGEASSTSTESTVNGFSVMADPIEDDGLELYYDDDYRFGKAKLIEVSGCINFASATQKATVSSIQVDPMFSFDGDLEYLEPMDLNGDDKAIPKENLYVFAAVDKDGKIVITEDEDKSKNEAITIFEGSTFNSAMPAPKPVASGLQTGTNKDKCYQDFCNFSFDAEYPWNYDEDISLTDAFVIVKYEDYEKNKTQAFTKDNTLWYKKAPDRVLDGKLYAVNTEEKDKITMTFDAAAYDLEGKAITSGLQTYIYYAPQGDDGEIYYVTDGYYEKMFKFNDGKATYEFDTSKFVKDEERSLYEYLWIKTTDGVNGLDLYSDAFTLTELADTKNITGDELELGDKKYKLQADLAWSQGVTYTGKKATVGQLAYAAEPDKYGKKQVARVCVSGFQLPNKDMEMWELFTVKCTPGKVKAVGAVGKFTLKVSLNTKKFNKAGWTGKEKKKIKKQLGKMIKNLNAKLKENKDTFTYTIEPVNLTFAEDVIIKATYKKQKIKVKNGKETSGDTGFDEESKKCIQIKDDGSLKKMKSLKIKAYINGISSEKPDGTKIKLKTFTISKKVAAKQFLISVTDQIENKADIETTDDCKNFFGKFKNVEVKK